MMATKSPDYAYGDIEAIVRCYRYLLEHDAMTTEAGESMAMSVPSEQRAELFARMIETEAAVNSGKRA